MKQKVLLILVDGMRPDAIDACSHPFLRNLRERSSYCMKSSTVMPSVTLPCHASLFFSVDPSRHGITTNVWTPMVRPIDSLADVVARFQKNAAMFYNWEQLRELNRPDSLIRSEFLRLREGHDKITDNILTDRAIDCIQNDDSDFIFLYLGYTDEAGHHFGWMSDAYLDAVSNASACIEKICKALPEDWSMVVTADHGGHDRNHGLDIPEDMTIPTYFYGSPFTPGKELCGVNIKDLAPTILSLLELPAPTEWEGHSLI